MRAAVVGTNWGGLHVTVLREAGVDVVALVGLERDATRQAADRLGVPAALTRLADLARLDLDLVTVATPAATHHDVLAALPDLPVLCEKPAVGLAPLRPVPAGRSAPVWVNYAFAFLDVARSAGRHLDRLGTIRGATAVSTHDLGHLAFSDAAMFMELVPHPWSWLVTVLGRPVPASGGSAEGETADGGTAAGGSAEGARGRAEILVTCGDVPVRLVCEREPGLAGIRHDVVLEGAQAVLHLRGTYRMEAGWRFDPPLLRRRGEPASAGRTVGEAETGPPDPWHRANARAVAAVVDAVAGGDPSPLLFRWDRALDLDRAAQATLVPRP